LAPDDPRQRASMTRRGAGLAALLVAAPVLVGIAYSTAASVGLLGPGSAGFSTASWTAAFDDPQLLRGLAWSLWVAAAATALATIAATAVATLFGTGTRSSVLARTLAVMPLPIPHIAAGVLGVLVLGQSGLLARGAFMAGWIDHPASMPALVYDHWGIGLILVLAWKEFPFLALIAFSLLADRGRALEEAARTLGAHRWAVFRTVTWPVLWRGLMPAVVAVFAFVAGTYEATVLLAPSDPLALPLLTIERYTDLGVASRGEAHVLVLVGLVVGLGAVALHEAARAWDRRAS